MKSILSQTRSNWILSITKSTSTRQFTSSTLQFNSSETSPQTSSSGDLPSSSPPSPPPSSSSKLPSLSQRLSSAKASISNSDSNLSSSKTTTSNNQSTKTSQLDPIRIKSQSSQSSSSSFNSPSRNNNNNNNNNQRERFQNNRNQSSKRSSNKNNKSLISSKNNNNNNNNLNNNQPLEISKQPTTPWNSTLYSISTSSHHSFSQITSPKTIQNPFDLSNLNSKNQNLPFPEISKRPLRIGERSLRINPLSDTRKIGLRDSIVFENERKGRNVDVSRGVKFETLLSENQVENGKGKVDGNGNENAKGDGKEEGGSLVNLERKSKELKLDEELGGDYKRFTSDYLKSLHLKTNSNSKNGNGNANNNNNRENQIEIDSLTRNIDLSPEARLWMLNAIQARINGRNNNASSSNNNNSPQSK